MGLGGRTPAFLHAPGLVMKAEGIDRLSREVAAERRTWESASALCELARVEAQSFGETISIDLFATAESAAAYWWPRSSHQIHCGLPLRPSPSPRRPGASTPG
jgi:hypothetical protein